MGGKGEAKIGLRETRYRKTKAAAIEVAESESVWMGTKVLLW
jgi:hypothetical protein